MSVEIKYKGNTIASANTEITKTIKTSGQYCEADIEVINTPDGGDAPVINPLSVTANGTYNAPSGVDGYSPVTVNVPQGITPTGTIDITENGTYDVTDKASAVVNVSGTPIEVPDDYEQYEYLESSGTQFIDTGYNAKLNSASEIDVMFLNGAQTYGVCFGTRNPWFMIATNYSINSDVARQGSFLTGFGSTNNKSFYASTYTKTKFKVTANATYMDGAIVWENSVPSLDETTTKIALFGRGERTFGIPCRIYRYKYWENDVLLLDMLPAMRKSDSVLGMYDIVNDVFYTNVGTGTFTGGALA